MRIKEAMNIIEAEEGFRVHFEKRESSILCSDFFPDRDEEMIKTEDEAWELARRFASAVSSVDYVNIYVCDKKFCPVIGYSEKKLNRL